MSSDAEPASVRPRGLTAILVATVVAGGAGYLTQVIVTAGYAPEDYARFNVFWSALYLVIAALSGIQQEVSRATTRVNGSVSRGMTSARAFALAVAGMVAVGVPLTALLWGQSVFPSHTIALVSALAVGAASYVAVAVLSGVFYGLSEWKVIGAQTMLDGLLRLVLVAIAVLSGASLDIVVWAVALPFPLTVLIVWPLVRRRIVGAYELDVPMRGLVRNTSLTVAGATATGLLISGFPLVVELTSKGESVATVGILLAAITLTRAPLIIPLMALQSFLTVYFRNHMTRIWRFVLLILAVVAILAAVASVLAALVGPAILAWINPAYTIDSAVMGVIVASAGFTAALCVSGPATLARGLHRAFFAGWLTAAIVLIGALLLPLDVTSRVVLALAIGPLVGLLVHLIALWRAFRATPPVVREEPTPRSEP